MDGKKDIYIDGFLSLSKIISRLFRSIFERGIDV